MNYLNSIILEGIIEDIKIIEDAVSLLLVSMGQIRIPVEINRAPIASRMAGLTSGKTIRVIGSLRHRQNGLYIQADTIDMSPQ